MLRADERRGFILATTLLVMVLLTVMLTAAFVMVSAEYRTTTSSFGATRALNFAQAGLERYISEAHNLSSGYDTTSYRFSGGYATVVARRLRDSTAATSQLWIIYSTGIDSSRQLLAEGGGGRRVVAQLATLNPGYLPHRAAMVAVNGVQIVKRGSGAGQVANPLDGDDTGFSAATYNNCPVSLRRDTSAVTTASYQNGGNDPQPNGPMELLASEQAVYDSARIDWPRLLAGEFTPDFVNTLPATCSGAGCAYRAYLHTGSVTIPGGTRRGLLIAYGDVTFLDGVHWDGIIIAGGRLIANNPGAQPNDTYRYTVHGMVITGLNRGRGQNVTANDIRRGSNRIIRWDWCYATAAISSQGYLIPIRGSMTDAWSTY